MLERWARQIVKYGKRSKAMKWPMVALLSLLYGLAAIQDALRPAMLRRYAAASLALALMLGLLPANALAADVKRKTVSRTAAVEVRAEERDAAPLAAGREITGVITASETWNDGDYIGEAGVEIKGGPLAAPVVITVNGKVTVKGPIKVMGAADAQAVELRGSDANAILDRWMETEPSTPGGDNYDGFTDSLITMYSSAKLTLSTIKLVGNQYRGVLGDVPAKKGVTSNGALINVKGGSRLFLESSAILTDNYSLNPGGGVSLYDGSKCTMKAGSEISECRAGAQGGGGVFVSAAQCELIMEGGTLTRNFVSSQRGGAVLVGSNGTFSMSGGSVTGNGAGNPEDRRGAVEMMDTTSRFKVSGSAVVAGNHVGHPATSGFNTADNSNVSLMLNQTFEVVGPLTTGADVNVKLATTLQPGGTFPVARKSGDSTYVPKTADAAYIHGDQDDYNGKLITSSDPTIDPIIVLEKPAVAPDAPRNVRATPGDESVKVTWTAPFSDGGSPVTEYLLKFYTVNADGTETPMEAATARVDKDLLFYMIPNYPKVLDNMQTYKVEIQAVNAVGPSIVIDRTFVPSTGPAAPENVTATPGDRKITLSWDEVTTGVESGKVVTYMIYYPPYDDPDNVYKVKGSTSKEISGLYNGEECEYEISATYKDSSDAIKEGPRVGVSATPRTTPGKPANLRDYPGDTQIRLTWEAPTKTGGSGEKLSDDGGAPITGYKVYKSVDNGGSWDAGEETDSDELEYTVTGLANGTEYKFKVTAVNEAGEGAVGAISSRTTKPYTVPGKVTLSGATAGDEQVTLAWSLADNGGNQVSDHVLYTSDDDGATWDSGRRINRNYAVTSYPVEHLTNGTKYTFKMSAENLAGAGEESDPLSATPVGKPGTPTDLEALVRTEDRGIDLQWKAPDSDGGSAITAYKIEYQKTSTGGAVWQEKELSTASAPSTVDTSDIAVVTYNGFAETDFDLGDAYTFRVSAVNAQGSSTASVTAEQSSYNGPSVPQNLEAQRGSEQVTLSWDAPADSGGKAVTGYQLKQDAGEWTTITPTSPRDAGGSYRYTVPSLTNGTSYSFKVRAFNGKGGTESAGVSVTPAAVPGAPTGLTAQAQPDAGAGGVVLNWTAPANNGSPITSYKIECQKKTDGSWESGWSPLSDYSLIARRAAGDTNYIVSGGDLEQGGEYRFQVAAVNAAGTGPYSSASIALDENGDPIPGGGGDDPGVVSYVAPGAPRDLRGRPGNEQVELSWTAPASDGGKAVERYEVRTADGTYTTTGTLYTVTGLTNGQAYDFHVRAYNGKYGPEADLGPSHDPDEEGQTTPDPHPGATWPDAPMNFTAAAGDARVVLNWSAPANDGGAPITKYQISKDDGASWEGVVDPADDTYTFSGLDNGRLYAFQVRAVNAKGAGDAASVTATPQANLFLVTLVDGGEGASGGGSYVPGDAVTLDPGTRRGYTFSGWTVTEGGVTVGADNTFTMPGGNVTVTANWTEQKGGGGGGSYNPAYKNTVADGIRKGVVKVDKEKAIKGTEITVTFTPGHKMLLKSYTITDADGRAVEHTMTGNTVTYEQPGSDVLIEGVFVWDNPFPDVKEGDWFYDDAEFANVNDAILGLPGGLFGPDVNATRSSIWTMLYRLEDHVTSPADKPWYVAAQEWAMAEGVSDGTNPDNVITREQLVTMLWRLEGKPFQDQHVLARFEDTQGISPWAAQAMSWGTKEGLLIGDEKGRLRPQAAATRAEVAAILHRLLRDWE